MRKVSLVFAALLVLAVVSPAFSQPFADVPTDHWAFDAIAELAAKGLVEGYPDGTFKGDRAMTRYEMAMVVARLLARVEAIKIPGPAAPPKIDVSRADITTLQRLINEFRAELAALGVRVTAVEEELAALRARVDNVRVTGNTFFRYTVPQSPGYQPSSTVPPGLPVPQLRNRFQFTGSVSPALVAVGRARFGTFTLQGPTALSAVNFDLAYFDWAGFFGTRWRVGRQQYTLGANGLLFDGGDQPPVNTTGYVDGARVNWGLGPVNLTAAVWRQSPLLDIWTLSAGFNLMPGWETAVQYYTERTLGGSSNSGFGVQIGAAIIPGVSFAVDYATFTASGGSAQSAYKASLNVDLGGLTGMTQFSPSLQLFYKNYGPDSGTPNGPLYSSSEADWIGDYSWNMKSWGAILDLAITPVISLSFEYETGTCKSTVVLGGADASGCTSANQPWTETFAQLRYAIARGATLDFQYISGSGASADSNQYRVELNYSW